MMSKSAGETSKSKYSPSQPAKPGVAQPHETVNSDPPEVTISSVSKEPFLAIKVQKGASLEDIVDAVEDALRTVENPFFQLSTPAENEQEGGFIPPGKGLAMYVRYEGP
jgi:hypothetical protein